MFSLESPHRSDSNEYTQYTIFNIKKKIALNYPKTAALGFCNGLKNEFETGVVNEPSVFEPLKFYCSKIPWKSISIYNRLSLSLLRLSRITAYLEEKIWPFFKRRNLTPGKKMLWIRGEIAPKEQFLPFSTILSV